MADYKKYPLMEDDDFKLLSEASLPVSDLAGLVRKMLPGTNIAAQPGTYIDHRAEVREVPIDRLTTPGWVHNAYPNTMFMSQDFRRGTNAFVRQAPGHELAHVQQNLANYKPTPTEQMNTERAAERVLLGAIQNPSSPERVQIPGNFSDGIRETLAGLQGLESQMPEGQTVWEHPVGRRLLEQFKDQKAARHRLDQQMFPTLNKLQSPDYFVPDDSYRPDVLTRLRQIIRKYTSGR